MTIIKIHTKKNGLFVFVLFVFVLLCHPHITVMVDGVKHQVTCFVVCLWCACMCVCGGRGVGGGFSTVIMM